MSYCIQCGAAARMAVPEGDSRPRLVCDVCTYIHYENPKLVTGVLAVHDDKILLCRRAIEPKLGYWTLPAGFMELGETMQAGALREMVEEAESQAVNARLYCLIDLPKAGQVHVMYLANIKDGKFGVGAESLESALFSVDALPWDELAFHSVAATLRHYIADRARFGDDWANYPVHEQAFSDVSI